MNNSLSFYLKRLINETIYSLFPVALLRLNKAERDEKILLSMTSFPERFDCAYLALKSAFLQSKKADRIILWLDKQVPISSLPKKILRMRKRGLEIRHARDNIFSHSKYYYSFCDYPDYVIVTIDDDIIYDKELINSLWKKHTIYKEAVVARRVHAIVCDTYRKVLPYSKWKMDYKDELSPTHGLLATGVGGVLYPRNCFSERAFNIKDIMKYALRTDDIWLKFMEILDERKVVYCENDKKLVEIARSQIRSLKKQNVEGGNNDICIDNLQTLFNLNLGEYALVSRQWKE